MRELFKDIFQAMVTVGLLVSVGFWLGVGLMLGVRAVLYWW